VAEFVRTLFCCDEPKDAEIHRSEDGHAPHATVEEAFRYLYQLTGGRADRVMDEYLAIVTRADELLKRCCMNDTHTDHWSDGYTQTCKIHGTRRTTDTGYDR
jgi:hypothetical protein